MTDWLAELLDEYPTKRTDAAINRLVRVYGDVPDSIMLKAVDSYMLDGHFFPKVADLRPFVREAQENARGDKAYEAIVQQVKYTDDDIMAWEIARRSMPTLVEIEDEIHLAQQELNGRSVSGLIGETVEGMRV